MAKTKLAAAKQWVARPRKKRPGVHSKKGRSRHKGSPRWIKPSRGQGS